MSVASIALLRCPKCLKGRVFVPFRRNPFRMNPRCPECGIGFEREPGFFFGALYFSYGIGVAVATPVYLYLSMSRGWPMARAMTATGALLAAMSPILFRYSRVLWLHADQKLDPR